MAKRISRSRSDLQSCTNDYGKNVSTPHRCFGFWGKKFSLSFADRDAAGAAFQLFFNSLSTTLLIISCWNFISVCSFVEKNLMHVPGTILSSATTVALCGGYIRTRHSLLLSLAYNSTLSSSLTLSSFVETKEFFYTRPYRDSFSPGRNLLVFHL